MLTFETRPHRASAETSYEECGTLRYQNLEYLRIYLLCTENLEYLVITYALCTENLEYLRIYLLCTENLEYLRIYLLCAENFKTAALAAESAVSELHHIIIQGQGSYISFSGIKAAILEDVHVTES